MKIKMISTEKGSVDGVKVSTYDADSEYDLGYPAGALALATAFVAAQVAVEVTSAPPSVTSVPDGPLPIGEMSKAQLQAALTEKSIAFPAAANKADLAALLTAGAQEAGADTDPADE